MVGVRRLIVLLTLLTVAHTAASQTVQLKIATMAPEGTGWVVEGRKAAEEIADATEGRVKIRIYPGGTMGGDQAVLRKMRIGQLQGGAIMSGSLSVAVPSAELYNLPLLFRDYEEVDLVRQQFDQRLIDLLEKKGYVVFGFVETGFVYLMSTKPTRSFEDLKGRKTWLPEGDSVSKAISDAAGLSPVPLAISDVMTGLQTGLIDTVAAPPVGAVALQWFTRAKYVTDLPITYVMGAIVASKKAFDRIKPEDQEVVREAMAAVTTALDTGARAENAEARKALEAQGVTFVDPTEETKVRWYEMAEEATQALIEAQDYDSALLAEIQSALTEFRSKRGQGSSGQ
jgi:TRAP-type C4-dicarboxylate transport system substrate-binding protein